MLASYHTQACLDAWVNCENVLFNIRNQFKSFSTRTVKTIDECAQICMGLFELFNSNKTDFKGLALLCVGICEECAEVCERYDEPLFQQCAETCRYCSNTISELAGTDA